ncbi:hypothetical protein AQUCO_01600079v1 [Aquilegia coerulea]|uniref:Uncharacterized protein n=1 Tax=Aquilegia coerulea TaxID=218851 RepID=A0A2G5DQ19_AQUCA|nr:hypothetical protein AQUCO_01600079v1 [Aquilegia coerulea]
MLCFRSVSISYLFLPTVFFLIFSTFFFSFSSSSRELVSQSHHLQFKPIQGLFGREEDWIVGQRRFIAEGSGTNGSVNNSSSLILAAERTRRRDPLNNFNRYTGGWNISERHYWASVGFTAVPLFIVALVWFAIFGLSLLLICCCFCCCRREPYGYSRTAYALSLIFLILFTISAIIGCIVLYTGQGKFYASTEDTLEYVVQQANVTADSLRNVSGYLAAAKGIKVVSVLLGPDVQTSIDEIDSKINSSATTVSEKTESNSDTIQEVLHDVRLCLIILAAVMLLLTFLGFLFSILGMQSLVSILVVMGWILVTGTFVLCGVFLLLHNVVADTCVAMDQWVQNPTAHTALDDILPCVDNATANESLLRSKQVSFQLVNVVNQVINNMSNANFPAFLPPPVNVNQSGPLVPVLCNPFNSDMTERQCITGEVGFDNATQVWKNYVCQVSSRGVCTTVGRLTPDYYDQMAAAVNVSFGLYHYGPFLVQLEDCTFVRDTFTDISRNHCPGLKKYVKWIYVGLVMVSVAVMLSLVFWVLYARERRHRVYTKHHMNGYGHGPSEEGRGI